MQLTGLRLGFIVLLCGAPLAASAHEGPEHEIEELTARMKMNGETAELLAERAVEYRVLGKMEEAAKDLERAAKLDPDSLPVHRELARVYYLRGDHRGAIDEIGRALKLDTGDPADTASLQMLRAEVLSSRKDDKEALKDCDAALRLYARNPEWYVLRSSIQQRLKMHSERISGLESGIRETGAGILKIERVEAMLDAAKFGDAMQVIEAELADSRIKSSWLIRRGRALLGLGRKVDAEADFKAALVEITDRLNPKAPDLQLLLDKALIHELLGERKDAVSAYEEAVGKGAADSAKDRIKALQQAAELERK